MVSLLGLAANGCASVAARADVEPLSFNDRTDELDKLGKLKESSFDNSPVAQIVVDKQGDTWLRKAAAASFANSFLLVQLVGDTAGTDQWMKLVKEMPRFLGLQPDVDWQHYSAFTTSAKWQGLVTEQRIEAFDSPSPSGMAISSWVILPVYQSASDPSWFWSSPDQGQFPPDAVLTGDFRRAAPAIMVASPASQPSCCRA